MEIQKKWSEIRHLDREEAEKTLDGEWLEAYNRFYEKYDDDMTRMTEIVEKLETMIEPPKVAKSAVLVMSAKTDGRTNCSRPSKNAPMAIPRNMNPGNRTSNAASARPSAIQTHQMVRKSIIARVLSAI